MLCFEFHVHSYSCGLLELSLSTTTTCMVEFFYLSLIHLWKICFLFTFAFSSRVAAKQVSHFILSHIIAFNGKCTLLYSFTEVSYLTVFLFVRLVSLDNPSISFLMLGLFYEITVSVFNFWEKYWMYFLENLVHGFVVTVHDLVLTGDRRRRRSCQVNLGHKIFRPHFETNNHSHSH